MYTLRLLSYQACVFSERFNVFVGIMGTCIAAE